MEKHELFANWVKENRLKRGMLQKDLASATGVSLQTIVAVEKGNSVALKTRVALARQFGTTTEEVFRLYNN